jgi:thiol-disulfide isomerase/thioredoxin
VRPGASPEAGIGAARRSLIAAVAGCALLLASPPRAALAQASRTTRPRGPALHGLPTLSALDGSPLQLQQYLGRPLLLNVWASWCAPCVAEMPALAALRQARGPHGSGQLEVIALNAGQSINQVEQFLLERPLQLPIVLDPGKNALARWQVRLLPTTLLFDAAGELVGRWTGERDWWAPAVLDELDRALGPPSGTCAAATGEWTARAGS